MNIVLRKSKKHIRRNEILLLELHELIQGSITGSHWREKRKKKQSELWFCSNPNICSNPEHFLIIINEVIIIPVM